MGLREVALLCGVDEELQDLQYLQPRELWKDGLKGYCPKVQTQQDLEVCLG